MKIATMFAMRTIRAAIAQTIALRGGESLRLMTAISLRFSAIFSWFRHNRLNAIYADHKIKNSRFASSSTMRATTIAISR